MNLSFFTFFKKKWRRARITPLGRGLYFDDKSCRDKLLLRALKALICESLKVLLFTSE